MYIIETGYVGIQDEEVFAEITNYLCEKSESNKPELTSVLVLIELFDCLVDFFRDGVRPIEEELKNEIEYDMVLKHLMKPDTSIEFYLS